MRAMVLRNMRMYSEDDLIGRNLHDAKFLAGPRRSLWKGIKDSEPYAAESSSAESGTLRMDMKYDVVSLCGRLQVMTAV